MIKQDIYSAIDKDCGSIRNSDIDSNIGKEFENELCDELGDDSEQITN